MNNLAIEVNQISKTFKISKPKGWSGLENQQHNKHSQGKLIAIDKMSFNVEKGEVLGIIGLNGSGKTTLLRIIAGVYTPDTGFVRINGMLSPLMQLGAGFQNDLIATDNIVMNGMLLGLSKQNIESKINDILEFAELTRFQNMKLKHFSSGMKSRLAFSTALQIKPDILLVDEILSVGDINFRKKSYEAFISFKKNNRTILHATHSLEKLQEFSDRVLLLNKGKMVMIGDPEEVIKQYRMIKPSN